MPERQRCCPHCRTDLRPVQAKARTGYLLQLDQCGSCGGLWCDKLELFPIASEEVDRLDPVDSQALHAPTSVAGTPGKCPRCEIALRVFTDPLLPPEIRIERCPLCEGMWLNAGVLRQFDAHRRRGRAPRPLSADAVQQLAQALGAPAVWSTARNLGGVMDDSEPPDEDGNLVGMAWQGAIWLALRTLLGLLFKT